MISWEILGQNLLVHESLHFLVGSIVSLLIFLKFRKKSLVLVVFLVTFLIDADHYTEWLLFDRLNNLWFSFTMPVNFWAESGKMTIFFHSWELIPLILILGRKINKWPLAQAISFALVGHLLTDQIVYSLLFGMSLFEYSFIYRAIHQFNFKELCSTC